MLPAHYLTEVLGVTSYICPPGIQALRHLEGGLPCRFLALVFDSLNSSEKTLLKKIMSSVGVFKYSILEVREEKILDELFEKADHFAQFVCLFGGPDFVQKGRLIQAEGQLVSALDAGIKCSFFQTAYSLKELSENSTAVHEKKQKLWKRLKLWKSSQF